MLRRAQYLLIALFGMWVIALLCPRTGLATTIIDNISVINPSFEQNVATLTGSDTHGSWNFSIDGWDISAANSGGTWLPNGTTFSSPVPQGSYVAFSNGGVISQGLGDTIASTGTYTLTVYVGHRNDVWPTVSFPNVPYFIGLFSGATFTGTNVLVSSYEPVSVGQWKAVTLTYTPSSGDPIGQQLGIFLYSAGIQVDFDKISLTRTYEIVPLPTSMLLLGSGLAGLGLLRFRRKKIS